MLLLRWQFFLLVGLLGIRQSGARPDPPSLTFSTDMRIVAFESAKHRGVYLRMDCQGIRNGCGGTVNAQLGQKPGIYERFVILPVRNMPQTFLIASAHFVGKYLSTYCEGTGWSSWSSLYRNHCRCCGKASLYERYQAIDNEDGTISIRSNYFESFLVLDSRGAAAMQNQSHDYGFGRGTCRFFDFRESHKFIVHELSTQLPTSSNLDRAGSEKSLCSTLSDSWVTIETCDGQNSNRTILCSYTLSVGIQSENSTSNRRMRRIFSEKLGKSRETGFNWAADHGGFFEKSASLQQSIKAEPGTTVEVQQIVGRCDGFEVRTQATRQIKTIIQMPTDAV